MENSQKYETSRNMLRRINEKRKLSANAKPMLFPVPNPQANMNSPTLQTQLNKLLQHEPDFDKEIDRDYDVVSSHLGSEGKNSNIGKKFLQLKDLAVELENGQNNDQSLSVSEEISSFQKEAFNFSDYFRNHQGQEEEKHIQVSQKASPLLPQKANATQTRQNTVKKESNKYETPLNTRSKSEDKGKEISPLNGIEILGDQSSVQEDDIEENVIQSNPAKQDVLSQNQSLFNKENGINQSDYKINKSYNVQNKNQDQVIQNQNELRQRNIQKKPSQLSTKQKEIKLETDIQVQNIVEFKNVQLSPIINQRKKVETKHNLNYQKTTECHTQQNNQDKGSPKQFDTNFKNIDLLFPDFIIRDRIRSGANPFDVQQENIVPANKEQDLNFNEDQAMEPNQRVRISINEFVLEEQKSPRDSTSRMTQKIVFCPKCQRDSATKAERIVTRTAQSQSLVKDIKHLMFSCFQGSFCYGSDDQIKVVYKCRTCHEILIS